MNVLDLWSGEGGFSEGFYCRGWNIIRIDNNPQVQHIPYTAIEDIMEKRTLLELCKLEQLDIIVAGPPCECFSIAAVDHYWKLEKGKYIPRNEKAKNAVKFVKRTLEYIEVLKPKYWFIENPRAMLRKMPFMMELPRRTITMCQYGSKYMKPTDIWTNCTPWQPRPMCKNRDSCHESSPRGSRRGVHGIRNSSISSIIPYDLSREICITVENELIANG